MINNFEPTQFLCKHWQKSPCLIKGGLSHPPAFISADELAGLSLEDEVESRIIRCDNNNWQMQSGPFDDENFSQLRGVPTCFDIVLNHLPGTAAATTATASGGNALPCIGNARP